MLEESPPDIYLVVVGFHHKKGYQIEFNHPAWPTGKFPPQWRHLPHLAMPDGAHNFTHQTVYFHLPPLDVASSTMFCVACFRQIDADKIMVKTDDITRNSVQKSVVVISKLPLYEYIKVKLHLLTDAYFSGGDFSNVDVLIQGVANLRQCLVRSNLSPSRYLTGVHVTELVAIFQHRLLQLFKLLLLERRVLILQPSAGQLSRRMVSLISLLPDTLVASSGETALKHAAVQPLPPCSPPASPSPPVLAATVSATAPPADTTSSHSPSPPLAVSQCRELAADFDVASSAPRQHSAAGASVDEPAMTVTAAGGGDTVTQLETKLAHQCAAICRLSAQRCGMPLKLFTKGNLFHPYLCLSDIHLLTDPSVRGFVAGASNAVFCRKSQLVDAVVTMSDDSAATNIELLDEQLRRQLTLSTEDLRFSELLVRAVNDPAAPDTDTWLRDLMRLYLYTMLRTSLQHTDTCAADAPFNSHYMNALRNTHAYRQWLCSSRDHIMQVNPGHPCSGQLSVTDMRIRLSHTMQNADKVRKVTMAAAATGRAVGDAFSAARGTLNSWWSSIGSEQPSAEEKPTN